MREDNVLIVEDAVVTSIALIKALQRLLPDCNLHRAASLRESRILLEHLPIKVAIVDLGLSDGCGMDLIPELVAQNPAAGIIILTATVREEYRDLAEACGVHHFLEKPVTAAVVANLVRELHESILYEGRVSDGTFHGRLSQLTPADILQLKCLNGASLALEFLHGDPLRGNARRGTVLVRDGELYHAESGSLTGAPDRQGSDALQEVLSWRGGRARETFAVEPLCRTLFGDWRLQLLGDEVPADAPLDCVA